MAFPGCDIITQATIRPTTYSGGTGTAKPFPAGSTANPNIRTLMVTAAKGNAGTIYFSTSGGTATATVREQTMVPLTSGQSLTFSSMGLGGAAPRQLVFGTGYTYIHASASANRAVISYTTQGS